MGKKFIRSPSHGEKQKDTRCRGQDSVGRNRSPCDIVGLKSNQQNTQKSYRFFISICQAQTLNACVKCKVIPKQDTHSRVYACVGMYS